jgi:hypothetical protein
MKKFLVPVTLALVLLSAPGIACADLIFVAQLSAAGENPATSSQALGLATYTLNSALTEIDFTISFGLDAGSPPLTSALSAGHIHFGTPDMNGPVILPFPNLPTGATSGTFSGALTAANLTPAGSIMTFADAVAAFEAGNTYTNLHTTMFPGGEIRGQNPAAPIPEPSSLMLLGIAVLGLLGHGWRRRQRLAMRMTI